MQGVHITADCLRCADPQGLMTDAPALAALSRRLLAEAGLVVVGEVLHRFPPGPRDDGRQAGGVTGVWLLAESHLAIHAWPEQCALTLDLYVCNQRHDNGAQADAVVDQLLAAFAPEDVLRQRIARGVVPPPPAAPRQPTVSPSADDGDRRHTTT